MRLRSFAALAAALLLAACAATGPNGPVGPSLSQIKNLVSKGSWTGRGQFAVNGCAGSLMLEITEITAEGGVSAVAQSQPSCGPTGTLVGGVGKDRVIYLSDPNRMWEIHLVPTSDADRAAAKIIRIQPRVSEDDGVIFERI